MIKTIKSHKGYLKKELRDMEQLKNPMVEAHEREAVHDGDDDDLLHSFSSSEISSGSSMESDSSEEVTSHLSSSSSSSDHLAAHDSLSDMSSLLHELPIKRGLSRYYDGRSRSFTSLASVRSLEDLAKPENPYNAMLKCCRRSYGGGWCSANAFSRHICKRRWHSSSRVSCSSHSSSLSARRNSVSFMASRPPIPPHRSTTTMSNQTALFA